MSLMISRLEVLSRILSLLVRMLKTDSIRSAFLLKLRTVDAATKDLRLAIDRPKVGSAKESEGA